ncbi:MAG: hypothetical protein HOM14_11365 [Gammaproteobacteria bacterium]|jgi:hypothetical protein|nr:hypothetical protein [Gammaproteobacteria bacterium]MBT4078717.1 hypothetical protein [Gammaproteobacteria bacterium]MBT4452181.1 hypothetical protein [Gammaproteobacteria bacterium]MBT4861510.1 hypothetical protein [Gammaproteobacteria bacterium]MBT6551940.1 hypothetical protein [Gammaproteobacteria bacterium]
MMGGEIGKDHFEVKDFELFQQKLDQEMDFMRQLFTENRFDNETRKLGYELELCLIDKTGAPSSCNKKVLDKANNDLFTYELATFNLEINGNAFELTHSVFSEIQQDLTNLYQEMEQATSGSGCEPGLFGVLPSLKLEHLNHNTYMSDMYRYRLLDERLMEMRQRPVHLEIKGEDTLMIDKLDVMLEALSTSLQVHYQFPVDEAVDSYHAALWSSMAAVAVSANSPLVLQKKCWQESRIAIFKQAVDTRNNQEVHDLIIPRVHFSKGYIKSWLELFDDNDYYSPILPEVIDSKVEELHHFNLHNGTIWRWVRPILGLGVNGLYHLRLELRVVPSGPTLIDTMANMVFHVGLTEGLKLKPQELTKMPFEGLEQDFYQVARDGLSANVNWCNGKMGSMQNLLLNHIIPVAYEGLEKLNIDSPEIWMNIIEQRVKTGQTGAQWIYMHWEKYQDEKLLVKDYMKQAKQNIPVHQWPKP